MRPPTDADPPEYHDEWAGYRAYFDRRARGMCPGQRFWRGWDRAHAEDEANAAPTPPCHSETVLPAHHANPTS